MKATSFATLPHPLNIMTQKQNTGSGKEQPSLGSGCPSPTAIGLTLRKNQPLGFEQQPKESNKAFAAFSAYLNLGPQRSLSKTAATLGQGKDMLAKWSCKFAWAARVAAFNSHMAALQREAAEVMVREKAVDWAQRQEQQRQMEWERRTKLVELADSMIERWQTNTEKCGTLEGIARLLDLASKLGRLSSGMPTDKTEVSAEVSATLDLDWEVAIRKIYGSQESQVIDVGGAVGEDVRSPSVPERDQPHPDASPRRLQSPATEQ